MVGLVSWYGQRTPLHFIVGNLNAQRYRDEILRPIVAPFVELHHVTYQHDNARPHISGGGGYSCPQLAALFA